MTKRRGAAASLAAAVVLAVAVPAMTSAPPVGPLPPGPTKKVALHAGETYRVVLPRAASGRVWRIARRYDAHVVREISESGKGGVVRLVFRAVSAGKTRVVLALTRGETPRAYAARTYAFTVSR